MKVLFLCKNSLLLLLLKGVSLFSQSSKTMSRRIMRKVIEMPAVICLMGPTASGKTALAIELVKHAPCEIISVDSAMIYREMNIGTAKPDADVLKIAPHRLLDIRDPVENYSAGEFRSDALREIESIIAQDKIPLLVGGTMLYFHVLQHGIAKLPQADQEIRQQILDDAEQYGWQALHERLQKIDPASAQRIHPNDPQRLQRALEVYEISGKTLTELQADDSQKDLPYHIINIAIAPMDRAVLHQKIAERFDLMLAQGFIEEVTKLFKRGDLHPDLPSMRAVGYRQIWDYLAGKLNYDEMRERAIIATRQLAKRQLTWLRSWENLHWLVSEEPDNLKNILKLI
jgi:tRNA dimethylallyltransferase